MKLTFHSAKQFQQKGKATIHSSGKLGFNDAAAKELNLQQGMQVLIATDDERNDNSLYIKICEGSHEKAFQVAKAGQYFYINTTRLFDSLGIDYKAKRIIFDITPIQIENDSFFKLSMRELKRKTA